MNLKEKFPDLWINIFKLLNSMLQVALALLLSGLSDGGLGVVAGVVVLLGVGLLIGLCWLCLGSLLSLVPLAEALLVFECQASNIVVHALLMPLKWMLSSEHKINKNWLCKFK